MFHSKPFKKDITPFAKGGKVVKHVGKGAKEQSTRGSSFASMTGGSEMARMANSYPKEAPAEAAPARSAPPVPMGSQSGGAPTAMMPPSMGEDEGE
jgi:hypothetical protein